VFIVKTAGSNTEICLRLQHPLTRLRQALCVKKTIFYHTEDNIKMYLKQLHLKMGQCGLHSSESGYNALAVSCKPTGAFFDSI
jgi:hypothetical protein